MERVCFQLQVRQDRIEEYKERHRRVWPDMLRALAEHGWHNYSLFLREDGLLIGYFETPSLEDALSGMERTEVNDRWQRQMTELFEDLGYLAAYAGKALADGTITGKEGDSFTAGKLGDYKVGADSTVLLGDPFVFEKSNIDDFNF